MRIQNKKRSPKRKGGNRRVRQNSKRTSSGASWLKPVASFVIIIMAFLGAGVGGYYSWHAFFKADFFALKSVEVRGLSRASSEEVLAWASLEKGVCVFKIDMDSVAASVSRHPWISDVRINRKLPNKLVITVGEHKAAILVALGSLYIADENGTVFKQLESADRVIAPVVTGIDRSFLTHEPEAGSALIKEALSILTEVHTRAGTEISVEELHWDLDLGWSLEVKNPLMHSSRQVRLELGHKGKKRVAKAVATMQRLAKMKRDVAVVRVNNSKHPDRVHVSLANSFSGISNSTMIARVE